MKSVFRATPGEEPDSELAWAVREGRTAAFRVLYMRHYPAVYAYTSRCVRTSLDAHQIANDAFSELLHRMRTQANSSGHRFAGCLRLQLLDSARAIAVNWCAREVASASPNFRKWINSGASWPMEEDGQLALVWDSLPREMRCVLWHTMPEQEGIPFVSEVTGIPRALVDSAHAAALNRFRQLRADLYLERLQRRDCRNAVEQLLAHYPGFPDSGCLEHAGICAECKAIYKNLIHLDARLMAQMPRQLLGWWPTDGYLSIKAATPIPLTDPPFLDLTLQRESPPSHGAPLTRRILSLKAKTGTVVIGFVIALTLGRNESPISEIGRTVASWPDVVFRALP